MMGRLVIVHTILWVLPSDQQMYEETGTGTHSFTEIWQNDVCTET
jgi:hypothetical protein